MHVKASQKHTEMKFVHNHLLFWKLLKKVIRLKPFVIHFPVDQIRKRPKQMSKKGHALVIQKHLIY